MPPPRRRRRRDGSICAPPFGGAARPGRAGTCRRRREHVELAGDGVVGVAGRPTACPATTRSTSATSAISSASDASTSRGPASSASHAPASSPHPASAAAAHSAISAAGVTLSSASRRVRSARSAPAAACRSVTPRRPASSIIASVAGVARMRQLAVSASTPPAACDASSLRVRHAARAQAAQRDVPPAIDPRPQRIEPHVLGLGLGSWGRRSSASSAATCGASPERGVPGARCPRRLPTRTCSIARATTRPRPSSSPCASALCTASTSSRRPGRGEPAQARERTASSAAARASGTLAGSPRARIARVISTRQRATSPAMSPLLAATPAIAAAATSGRGCRPGSRSACRAARTCTGSATTPCPLPRRRRPARRAASRRRRRAPPRGTRR